MDGSTQPLIAVIGYPIAGNPAQFALLRALAAMGLDWGVLSFEIPPDQLGAALDGIQVLRFHGVLVDPTIADLTGKWYAQRHGTAAGEPQRLDCLYGSSPYPGSDEPFELCGADAQGDWLREAVQRHFESRGRQPERGLCFGPEDFRWDFLGLGSIDSTRCDRFPEPEQIEKADVVVLTIGSERVLSMDAEDWPMNDASTLVIDLTELGHSEADTIESHGFQLVTLEQRRVGTLVHALRHWTGCDPDRELIQDAIEEYLAI